MGGKCEFVRVSKEVRLSSPERIWQSDSSEARTLIGRRASMQVGRPWLFQKQENREDQWSLPWPTDITPQLCKKKKKCGEERRTREKTDQENTEQCDGYTE